MHKKFLILIVLLSSFFLTDIFAQNKDAKALLYKITGNGLTKPSYLYGTMHVSSKIAFNLSDSFFVALRSADLVTLEINPDSFMNYSMRYDINYIDPGFRYKGNKNFYIDATEMKPMDMSILKSALYDIDALTNYLLFRNRQFNNNYEESTYLDLFIFQVGKKLKKEIGQVEDYNTTTELLAKASINDPDEENDYYNDDNNGKDKPIYEQIDDAYRNRDIHLIDSLSQLSSPSKKYHKYFIVERNKNQANALELLMKKNSVFCGIGAAHLGGDSGVVNLLRAKGYTVTPVIQQSSKSSRKTTDKLADLDYPLTFKPFFAKDSAFTVNLPAMVYQMDYSQNATMYYCPEMVNGAYYQILRFHTPEGFLGKSPAQKLNFIDSLLYEAMPGKIQKKETIVSNSGVKGIQVTSLTKEGNVIKAYIYPGELETYIFKVRGNDDYAIQKNGNLFFSSIRFSPEKSQDISEYTDVSAGVSVKMPQNRVSDNRVTSTMRIMSPQILNAEAYDQNGKRRYYLTVSAFNDMEYLEEDTFELHALVKEYFEGMDIKNFTSFQTIQNGQTVMQGTGKKDGRNYFVQTALKGPLYAILSVSANDSIFPSEYFSSFRWVKHQYKSEMIAERDTALHFTTMNLKNEINESSKKLYNQVRSSMGIFGSQVTPVKEEELILEGETKTKTYSSSESPEFIEVTYKRYPKYTEYDSANFNFLTDYYFGDNFSGYIKKTLKDKKQNGIREIIQQYTDTAVSRCIMYKYIIKDGTLYTLKTMADSTEGLTGWSKAFFENFVPEDTVLGIDIFKSKGNLYLSDLMSSDSVTKAIAKKANSSIVFKKESCNKLIEYLSSSEFKTLKEDEKADLIENIGQIDNPQLTDLLVSIYKNTSDSVSVLKAVLEALASQKTKKSFEAFMSLMEYDTPLGTESGSFRSIYAPMFDTLNLTKQLFPALLVYTRYPEHKKSIYALLITLINDKKLDKKIIEDNYRSILADANDELKRAKQSGNFEDDFEYSDLFEFSEDFLLPTEKKDSAKVDQIKYEFNSLLSNLMELLVLDYSQNSNSRAFFEKAIGTKQNKIIFSTAKILNDHSISIPDSTWRNLSKQDKMTLDVFKLLKKNNLLHLMDSSILTQENFARLLIKEYQNDDDSIIFIKKEAGIIKGISGYIYYFKTKTSYAKQWSLSIIGPFPADGKTVIMDPKMIQFGVSLISKRKGEEKEIEKAKKDYFYYDRKRAQGGYGGGFMF